MTNKPTYYELLRHPFWQRKRLEILSRAHFKCEECGAKEKTLEVHHTYYERGLKPWEYPDTSLHCLCSDCHRQAQDALTLLHRAMGLIEDVRQIETIYGFTLGYDAVANPDRPLDVFSPWVSQGLASYFELSYDDVVDVVEAGDGVIDGAKLIAMREAIRARRRAGLPE